MSFFNFILLVNFVTVYLQIIFVKSPLQHDHQSLTIEYLPTNRVFVKQLNIRKKRRVFNDKQNKINNIKFYFIIQITCLIFHSYIN